MAQAKARIWPGLSYACRVLEVMCAPKVLGVEEDAVWHVLQRLAWRVREERVRERGAGEREGVCVRERKGERERKSESVCVCASENERERM